MSVNVGVIKTTASRLLDKLGLGLGFGFGLTALFLGVVAAIIFAAVTIYAVGKGILAVVIGIATSHLTLIILWLAAAVCVLLWIAYRLLRRGDPSQ